MKTKWNCIAGSAAVLTALTVGGLSAHSQNTRQQSASESKSPTEPAPLQIAGLQLVARLRSGKTTFDPLEPIVAVLTLRNNSRQIVSFTETASALDFDVSARDAQGEVVPATRFGAKTPGEVRASSATRRTILSPGEAMEFAIAFNRLVDLSRNGVYQIKFQRAVEIHQKGSFAKGRSGFVESRTLEVSVTASSDSVVVGRKVR